MKCFVAVTRFLKGKRQKDYFQYYFHFRGVYEGHVVQGIVVEGDSQDNLIKGEDYLLYLQFIKIEEGFIRAQFLKIKSLRNITC